MKEINEKLAQAAESGPIFNAVFHVFALRKRARSTVMLTSLYYKMRREGFDYKRSEYRPVIKLLSDLGLGTPIFDRRGQITGVKDIKLTLQSIGFIACKQDTRGEPFRKRNTFIGLVPKPEVIKSTVKSIEVKSEPKSHDISVNIAWNVNGKCINIPVPKDLSADELAVIINKLH